MTSLQDIINAYPDFMSAEKRDDELQLFSELCIKHILLYVLDKKTMSQEETNSLLYILCTINNFPAFYRIAEITIHHWVELGISSEIYEYVIEANCQAFSTENPSHRTRYLYGLNPATPNLINTIHTLIKLELDPAEAIDSEMLEGILLSIQPPQNQADAQETDSAEEHAFDAFERQLWDATSPIKPGQLLEICNTYPQLLSTFLNKKRNEQNINVNYIQRIFIALICAEEDLVGGSDEAGGDVDQLLTFMDILYQNIDLSDFQTQQTELVDRFINSQSLALIDWLAANVSDPSQQKRLDKTTREIRNEIGDDSTDEETNSIDFNRKNSNFSHFFSAPQTAACGLPLNDPKLHKIVLFLQQHGFDSNDVIAMDAEMLEATLISLEFKFSPFAVQEITDLWQDSEFIDSYLLYYKDALAKNNYGLMPSITALEALDPAYLKDVVQGKTGILRSTHVHEGLFSADKPRPFSHLLYPTCVSRNHFGLLVLHFDRNGELEGIFYFEPQKKRGFQNLQTILKNMPDVPTIQIPMDQIDDDFCGDYVLAAILGITHKLNLNIISWPEYRKNQASEISKIQTDPNYLQFVGRQLAMESIEYLRCDMAIKLGLPFVSYLNPRKTLSEAEFQATILPSIQQRHRELNALHHIWQVKSHIHMSSLHGASLQEKLLNYITSRRDATQDSCLVLSTEETIGIRHRQRGETSKLAALANAIDHAAYKNKTLQPPIPLYKDKTHSISLRQLAKQYGGSVVGEMYTVESLLNTCRAAGYEAEYYAPCNDDEYIRQLKALLDQSLSPMIFFDIDLNDGVRHGFPFIGDGKNEHAAVVIGYYTNNDGEIRFIVTNDSHFYDFDGQELALSSCYSLAEKREVETFCKVKGSDSKTKWVLKNKANLYEKIMAPPPERTALPMTDNDTPLKGKIMVVTGPVAANDHLSFFAASSGKDEISTNKAQSSSRLPKWLGQP